MNAMGSIDSRISALVKPSANRKSVSADGELANKFKNLLNSKAEMSEFREQVIGGNTQTVSSSNKIVKQDKLTTNGYGDIPRKLDELQKIHEETDYSGMSDVEIYRTIRGRFERAFPNLEAKVDRWAIPKELNTITNLKMMQLEDVIKDSSVYKPYSSKERLINIEKAYFGYEGMSNEEILKAHQERFSGDGSLDAKGQFLHELRNLGLIEDSVCTSYIISVRREGARAYKAHFKTNVVPREFDNEWLLYDFGNKNMSWSEAKSLIFKEKDIVEYFGKEVMKNIEELFDMFAEEENKRMGIR